MVFEEVFKKEDGCESGCEKEGGDGEEEIVEVDETGAFKGFAVHHQDGDCFDEEEIESGEDYWVVPCGQGCYAGSKSPILDSYEESFHTSHCIRCKVHPEVVKFLFIFLFQSSVFVLLRI